MCFYCFDLPQFRGMRMAAVVVLFLCFGAASLPLTYLLSFAFSDEMRGLQVQNRYPQVMNEKEGSGHFCS